jgi:hypothetical protein
MNIPATTLDAVTTAQKEVRFNQATAAMSKAALFGVKTRLTVGLKFTLYGGTFPADSGPIHIGDQTLTLTASTTNYIYCDNAAVIFKTTSTPTGWPGPLASNQRALYQLTVGANSITSGTSYVVGVGTVGPIGPTGAVGPAGDELYKRRKRVQMTIGGGTGNQTSLAFTLGSSNGAGSARTLSSASLRESIPYGGYNSNDSTSPGISIQLWSNENFCYFGNAAGRGGFDVAFRFCIENGYVANVANQRGFYGLFDVASGTIGNVEPDTLTNIIGIGYKAGDANFSLIYNDGSGTATLTGLGANFPARATNNVYELRLVSVANSQSVTYTLTNIDTGNVATGTLSSNLPASTQFLGWTMWTNKGTSTGLITLGFMQVVGETRY